LDAFVVRLVYDLAAVEMEDQNSIADGSMSQINKLLREFHT